MALLASVLDAACAGGEDAAPEIGMEGVTWTLELMGEAGPVARFRGSAER